MHVRHQLRKALSRSICREKHFVERGQSRPVLRSGVHRRTGGTGRGAGQGETSISGGRRGRGLRSLQSRTVKDQSLGFGLTALRRDFFTIEQKADAGGISYFDDEFTAGTDRSVSRSYKIFAVAQL